MAQHNPKIVRRSNGLLGCESTLDLAGSAATASTVARSLDGPAAHPALERGHQRGVGEFPGTVGDRLAVDLVDAQVITVTAVATDAGTTVRSRHPYCQNHRPGAVGAPVVAGHVARMVSGHNLGMIFVLDTNVLLSNAKLQSGWWTDFVSRVTELGGRIVVPAVVLEETIANHNRRLRGLIASFRDVGKREKSLGIEVIHDAVEAAIVAKTDDFGPALRRYLDDADVEIVDPLRFRT